MLITFGEGPRADSFADNLSGFFMFWIFDIPPTYNSTLTVFDFGKLIFDVLQYFLDTIKKSS